MMMGCINCFGHCSSLLTLLYSFFANAFIKSCFWNLFSIGQFVLPDLWLKCPGEVSDNFHSTLEHFSLDGSKPNYLVLFSFCEGCWSNRLIPFSYFSIGILVCNCQILPIQCATFVSPQSDNGQSEAETYYYDCPQSRCSYGSSISGQTFSQFISLVYISWYICESGLILNLFLWIVFFSCHGCCFMIWVSSWCKAWGKDLMHIAGVRILSKLDLYFSFWNAKVSQWRLLWKFRW